MKAVTVSASKTYPIYIGSGLLKKSGEHIAQLPGIRRICIVSDSNVFPLYGALLTENLEQSGFQLCSYVFPAGEERKNSHTYLELLNFLAQNQLTRSDCILALGGGVVGDLAGFSAATYLRGVRYIQIPTTVLAAVDSSVGGKTAIDLPAGKNLAGAFWQPSLVLCDTDTLSSLPVEIFADGCAEVIKYAVLYDPELFALLEKDGLCFDRETIIARCIDWKRRAVELDEFDTGERMKLNLGHTIGHAIEKCSNFSISHGQAVAIGMAIAARGTDCIDTKRIERLLTQFALPIHCSYHAEDLLQKARSDKKRSADTINLIIPKMIGHCEIVSSTFDELRSILEAGI